MFDRIKNSLKFKPFNTLAIVIIVVLFSTLHYGIIIHDFVRDHEPVAIHISESIKNGMCETAGFVTEHNFYVINHTKNKLYTIDHNDKSCVEVDNHDKLQEELHHKMLFNILVKEKENIKINIMFPCHVMFKIDDMTISIDIKGILGVENATIILFLILTILLMVFFKLSMIKQDTQIVNLKISAQEYVLSERTISFLVSIMHHKLNTPMKVIATKTRVLAETIAAHKDKTISDDVIKTSEQNYVQLHDAINSITKMTNKLKEYNELSQNETNVYNICMVATDTIGILKDDEFNIEIDYKTKLYDIDTDSIRSHEIIQIFINQIKFSLGQQFADNINFKIYKTSEDSITILYTDNGNQLEKRVLTLIKNRTDVSDLLNNEVEQDYIDLILNFNILNANKQSNIRLLSSNKNGNLFEIKLPTIKNKEILS